LFYGGIIFDMNTFKFSFNPIMGIYYPQIRPLIPILTYIPTTKNRSYKFSRILAFFFCSTVI
ncbi:hypothetical protein, partial [Bacteroides heparinolyticus]|uniref:hypothetical protein n=1 Tax=Prevotella heparinolytica TaxID=28113 RepID=UPI00359FC259